MLELFYSVVFIAACIFSAVLIARFILYYNKQNESITIIPLEAKLPVAKLEVFPDHSYFYTTEITKTTEIKPTVKKPSKPRKPRAKKPVV